MRKNLISGQHYSICWHLVNGHIYLLCKFVTEAASSADYCSLKMIWCSLSKIRTHKGGDESLVYVCVCFFYLSLWVHHSSSSLHLNWRQHRCRPRSPFPSNSRLRVSICMDKLKHNALPHSTWSSVEILTNEHKFLKIAYYFTIIQDQLLFFPIIIEVSDRKTIMCCCET